MTTTISTDESFCAQCGALTHAGTAFCSRECARLAPVTSALVRIADALNGIRDGAKASPESIATIARRMLDEENDAAHALPRET